MSDYLTGSVPISEAIEKALSGLLAYLGGELSLVVTTLTEDKAFLEVRGHQAHRPAHLIEEINEKRPLSEIPVSHQVLKEQRPITLSRQQAEEKFRVRRAAVQHLLSLCRLLSTFNGGRRSHWHSSYQHVAARAHILL
ncbi:MAG: hypothetical protein M5U34_25805 [Chloroflexi bacterium]|nr:hypothetical protein [Chloroflexota bacterium]